MASHNASRQRLAILFLAILCACSEASSSERRFYSIGARNVQETFHRRATDTLTFSGDVDKIIDRANQVGRDKALEAANGGSSDVISVEPPTDDDNDDQTTDLFEDFDILGAATKAPTATSAGTSVPVQTPVPGLVTPSAPLSPTAVPESIPQPGSPSSPSSAPAIVATAAPVGNDAEYVFYIPTKDPSAAGATVSTGTTMPVSPDATSTSTSGPTALGQSTNSSAPFQPPGGVGADCDDTTSVSRIWCAPSTQESTGLNPQPTGTGSGTPASPTSTTGSGTPASPTSTTGSTAQAPSSIAVTGSLEMTSPESSESNPGPPSTATGTAGTTGPPVASNNEGPPTGTVPNPGAPSSISSSPASSPQDSSPTTQEAIPVSAPSSPTTSDTSSQPGGAPSPAASPVAATQPKGSPSSPTTSDSSSQPGGGGMPSPTSTTSPDSSGGSQSTPTTSDTSFQPGGASPSTPATSPTTSTQPKGSPISPTTSSQPEGSPSSPATSPVAANSQPSAQSPTLSPAQTINAVAPSSEPAPVYPTPLFLSSSPVAPTVEAPSSSQPVSPTALLPSLLPTVTTAPVVSVIVVDGDLSDLANSPTNSDTAGGISWVTKSPSVNSPAPVDTAPTTNAALQPSSVLQTQPLPTGPMSAPSPDNTETATMPTSQSEWNPPVPSPVGSPDITNPTAVPVPTTNSAGPDGAPSNSMPGSSPTVQAPASEPEAATNSPMADVSITEAPFAQGWSGNISDPVTPDSIVAACSDVSLERPETIDFVYSLETNPNRRESLESVRKAFEIALSKDIANLLLPCDIGLEPLDDNELGFEGIDFVPEDIISEPSNCDATVDITNDCTIFDGILTIYISPEADFELARYYTLTAIRETISMLDLQIEDLAKATYLGPEIVNPSSFAEPEDLPGGVAPGPDNINASLVLFAVGGCAFAASIALVYYLRRHGTSSSGAATQAAGSDQYTGSARDEPSRPLSPFSEMLPSAYRFDADGNMSAILELDDESATQRSGVVSENYTDGYTTAEEQDTVVSMDGGVSLNRLDHSPLSMLGARKRHDESMDSLLELM